MYRDSQDPRKFIAQRRASKKYYALHREERLVAAMSYRKANPDARRETKRKYDAANHDKHCADSVRRRARKLNQFVEDVDREVVFLNDNGVCQWQYCQEDSPFVDPANWHLDHIVPLSKGGEHSYANTQVAHPTCNQRKSDSLAYTP